MPKKKNSEWTFSIIVLIVGIVIVSYQHYHKEQVQQAQSQASIASYKECAAQTYNDYEPAIQSSLADPDAQGASSVLPDYYNALKQC